MSSSIAGHDGFEITWRLFGDEIRSRADTGRSEGYASAGITVNAYCPNSWGTDMWVEIDGFQN
jgi:meso-butanediol dehydrogenase/(S,S)-butanediol dehydrogenase/diacetyl reductase